MADSLGRRGKLRLEIILKGSLKILFHLDCSLHPHRVTHRSNLKFSTFKR